jgi:DUF971 family protein
MTELWPEELRLSADRATLAVRFNDGSAYALPAELLRVESPSAEVKGHTPDQAQLVFGKRAVAIAAIEAVGNYAVRLTFSDGHSTGIYTWDYLARLGRDQSTIWQAYLAKLEAAGKTRG